MADAPPTSPRLARRKPRMNSYSAQSWLDNEKNAVGKLKPMRTVSSHPSQPVPNRCCPFRRSPSQYVGDQRPGRQQAGHRPDPSVPHLKYGLFTNPRKAVIINGLNNAVTTRPALKKKATSAEIALRKERRGEAEGGEEEEYEEPDRQPSDAPMLVFRPISHSYTQRLSASNVRHMDIKPGRRPIASPHLPRITIM